jgi:hypothetical protein
MRIPRWPPTTFHYDLILKDIGSTNLGTFWFAWTPGEDFMPASPSSVISPASWTEMVTHAGPSDGFAIQWVAGAGAQITPGNSLVGFGFDSTVTPQQMAGPSPFFTHPPVTTSFVYSGAPFSDAGFQFVVRTTPEPSTAMSIMIGAALIAIHALTRARNRGVAD